jgi:hypothetical protein
MVRKFVSATVSAALCVLSVAPGVAMAQEYRFAGFDAPRGATATINLRVPMGPEHRERATYGLSFGYGQTLGAPGLNGQTMTRAVNLADLRFAGNELRNARLATFDLANLDQDRRVSNLRADGSVIWVAVIAAVGVGVLICVAADCFEDDDEDLPD